MERLFTPNNTFRFKEINNSYDDGTQGGNKYRDEYRRDYARIMHSPAFRRLENKTQLFPGRESDFFRNRLTHSLEVAQISKTIAYKINRQLNTNMILPDVCEIAGLIHDIGHPPFGHNGEKALDDCMKDCGGFEGNAQSIHIITRLEKKEPSESSKCFSDTGADNRYGLNLTARSIASALKYDTAIPIFRDPNSKLVKGYYLSEKPIIDRIKQELIGCESCDNFKTIECSIMDIADDIAYSTYDIEDAFKAGFLTPYEMMSAPSGIYQQISEKLKEADIVADADECRGIVIALFSDVWQDMIEIQKQIRADDVDYENKTILNYINSYIYSQNLAADGYLRTKFTSFLISKFVNGLSVKSNIDHPILSTITVDEQIKKEINILKHFSFICLINSSRLKVAESRGYEIIKKIFSKLADPGGFKLLPEDFQQLYHQSCTDEGKRRIICDFIAGMTDRYALEFYGRLFSENPQTIFKPL